MPARVLLVEPDETITNAFSRLLLRHGFEVAAAFNECDYMHHLCESAPDVLVVEPFSNDDWQLRLISIPERKREFPVIVVSRLSPEEFEGRFSHADCWLTKPVPSQTLIETITLVMQRFRSGSRV